ncbi:MAG TPA: hypothetical protein VFT06_16085 [Flavisolibacter sp.]|nr:hypothetical protein [Flavisolibacter sp.]
MASKENKGGILKNDQVEQDLKAKGKTPEANETYRGAQDTGDRNVRHMGNEVQKADGRPAEEEKSGES